MLTNTTRIPERCSGGINNNLTCITLHGELGEAIGKEWNLAVNSVGEAIRAIEILSKRKLFKYLYKKHDQCRALYKVLINGKQFVSSQELKLEEPKTIIDSELMIEFKSGSLQTIDIIPVIEGAGKIGSILSVVLGAILIVAGAIFAQPMLIVAGIGLLGAGIINLLSKPPKFDNYQDFQNSKQSFLFNGPYNTTEEGGPVPVGYGELIVGSQVISTSYDITYFPADLTKDEQQSVGLFGPGDYDKNFEITIRTIMEVPSSQNNSNVNTNTIYI